MACTSKKWNKILSSWERSGLSQREFCNQKDLSLSTFYYWKRKLDNETTQNSELVKIETRNILPTASSFVLDFPGGIKLTIPSHYNSDHLKRLISDLREEIL